MEDKKIVKVPKGKTEEAERLFKSFCVSANENPVSDETFIEYKITGMPSLVAGFFANAVNARGVIKFDACPRFV